MILEKKGDADTLEFYMFEDNVSGRMTAVRKIDVEDYANKEDPFSGGKFEFSYKTEMNIKEAEMYMFISKRREKLERIVLKERTEDKALNLVVQAMLSQVVKIIKSLYSSLKAIKVIQ